MRLRLRQAVALRRLVLTGPAAAAAGWGRGRRAGGAPTRGRGMAAAAGAAGGLRLVDASPGAAGAEGFKFGPWDIAPTEVFARTERSFAFVNLKPVVPGHVLVSPVRVVPRFAELEGAEVADMWLLAQRVGRELEAHHAATSLTLTVQDGPQAGQTVPHVHIHVLPRRVGDFQNNDEIYDAIDAASEGQAAAAAGKPLDLDEERKPRTREEMAAEAAELRELFAV